jgi:hypothetical protein
LKESGRRCWYSAVAGWFRASNPSADEAAAAIAAAAAAPAAATAAAAAAASAAAAADLTKNID